MFLSVHEAIKMKVLGDKNPQSSFCIKMLLQAKLNLIFLFKIPFFCSAASLEADPVTCVYI